MAQLTLIRNINCEYAPRYYTMTGDDFDAMLSAVKALPARTWMDSEKAWLVNADGIKALRAVGYTVERDADIRVDMPANWIAEVGHSGRSGRFALVSVAVRLPDARRWGTFASWSIPAGQGTVGEVMDASKAARDKIISTFTAAMAGKTRTEASIKAACEEVKALTF